MQWSVIFFSVYAGLRSLLIFLECCLLSYVCSVFTTENGGSGGKSGGINGGIYEVCHYSLKV